MGTSARAGVNVEFRATGVDAVRRDLKLVRGDGENFGREGARGARMMAGALADIAREGVVARAPLKELVKSGAEMAVAFGVGGPILGAVALLGLAFANTFIRAREQIEETERQFRASLASMVKARDETGLFKKQQELFGGDATALIEGRRKDETDEQFTARLLGVRGLETLIGSLQSESKAAFKIWDDFATRGIKPANGNAQEFYNTIERNRQSLAKLEPLLVQQKEQYRQTATQATIIAAAESDRLKNEIKLANEDPAKQLELLNRQLEVYAEQMDRIDAANKKREGLLKAPLGQIGAPGRMLSAQEQLDKAFPVNRPGDVVGPKVAEIIQTAGERLVKQFYEEVQKPLEEAIRGGFASSMGSAISDAFSAGFSESSIGGAFRAFGKSILGGIGGIFEQMGQVWLKYGIIMTALGKALWNPLTSGPAAIAIGIALTALGGALGGIAHQTHGGGGGGAVGASSPPQIIDRGVINPSLVNAGAGVTVRQPITMNNFIVGPDDAQAQRQITKLLKNARANGHPV